MKILLIILYDVLYPNPIFSLKNSNLGFLTNNINRAQENSFTISNKYGQIIYAEELLSDSTEYIFTWN